MSSPLKQKVEVETQSPEQMEIEHRFEFIQKGVEKILDNIFSIRLALEAGDMQYFPPPRRFDPMKTFGKYE